MNQSTGIHAVPPDGASDAGSACAGETFNMTDLYLADLKPKRRSKYGVRTDAAGKAERTLDGILFASKAEMKRHAELLILERAGEISGLQRQVPFPLKVEGVLIATYVADWTYTEDNTLIAEDRKSPPVRKRPDFIMKKKLFKALYWGWHLRLT